MEARRHKVVQPKEPRKVLRENTVSNYTLAKGKTYTGIISKEECHL